MKSLKLLITTIFIVFDVSAQTFTVSSTPELVWDRSIEKCSNSDTVDTAFRPFKVRLNTNKEKIVAFNGHYDSNYPFVGRSLNELVRRCDNPSFVSELNPEFEAHSNYEWVSSIWASGRLVTAVLHNEYHGHEYYSECSSYTSCWWNSITLAYSLFGGRSFTKSLVGSNRIVAALPPPFETNTGARGFFSPSNIVYDRRTKYFYMMVRTFPRSDGVDDYISSGTCLLRAKAIRRFNMKAPDYVWRGWDGEDFTANLANGEACMPLANIGHMDISLSYNTELAKWILVDTLGGPNFPNYGVYYSLSDDLINWQAPTQLLAAPHPVNNGIAYPSIVDPDEFEQNYYHSDNQFYLYYVKFNNGQGGLNRDIERVSITLQNDS